MERSDQTPEPMKGTGVDQKPAERRGGKANKRSRRRWWKSAALILLIALLLLIATAVGALAGYRSGAQTRQAIATELASLSLKEQYDLAVEDMESGRFEMARQRLEYILTIDPDYPDVANRLAQAMAVLYATATPTQPAPTTTPTPTRDLRPVQELFAQAKTLLSDQKWSEAIDTLLSLRQADANYETARVDGMLYLSLRQRGVDKIWRQGNLEGGIYDLTLAARFGPLDVQANSARELARLYLFGSSFWEVYPEQAVYYFSQVAAAAPGLRDASGWTAAARYRAALVQYGDYLMGLKDWCKAQVQYELALSMSADVTVQQKRDQAALLCSPPTKTPKPTEPLTPTSTEPGATPIPPTATNSLPPTATNTLPPPPPTDTPPPPTATPLPPTNTPPPPPLTDTPPVYPPPAPG
jgi:tetratricopeptide (TPR) repeat protein